MRIITKEKTTPIGLRLSDSSRLKFDEVVNHLKVKVKNEFQRNFGMVDFINMCCELPTEMLEQQALDYIDRKLKVKVKSVNLSPEAQRQINAILEAEAQKNKQS